MKTLTHNNSAIKLLEAKDINNISIITYLFGSKINSYVAYLYIVANIEDMEDIISITNYQEYNENGTTYDFENEYHNDYFEGYSNKDLDIIEEIKRITQRYKMGEHKKQTLIKKYNKLLEE